MWLNYNITQMKVTEIDGTIIEVYNPPANDSFGNNIGVSYRFILAVVLSYSLSVCLWHPIVILIKSYLLLEKFKSKKNEDMICEAYYFCELTKLIEMYEKNYCNMNDNNNNNNNNNNKYNSRIEGEFAQIVLPEAPKTLNTSLAGEGESGFEMQRVKTLENVLKDEIIIIGDLDYENENENRHSADNNKYNNVNRSEFCEWNEKEALNWLKYVLKNANDEKNEINEFCKRVEKVAMTGKIMMKYVTTSNGDKNILVQKLQSKIQYNKKSFIWEAFAKELTRIYGFGTKNGWKANGIYI